MSLFKNLKENVHKNGKIPPLAVFVEATSLKRVKERYHGSFLPAAEQPPQLPVEHSQLVWPLRVINSVAINTINCANVHMKGLRRDSWVEHWSVTTASFPRRLVQDNVRLKPPSNTSSWNNQDLNPWKNKQTRFTTATLTAGISNMLGLFLKINKCFWWNIFFNY